MGDPPGVDEHADGHVVASPEDADTGLKTGAGPGVPRPAKRPASAMTGEPVEEAPSARPRTKAIGAHQPALAAATTEAAATMGVGPGRGGVGSSWAYGEEQARGSPTAVGAAAQVAEDAFDGAHCGDSVGAGAAVLDADTVVVDADSIIVDADTVVVDADTVVVDADSIIVDADTVVVDADSIIVDADTVVVDADTVVVDADTVVIGCGTAAAVGTRLDAAKQPKQPRARAGASGLGAGTASTTPSTNMGDDTVVASMGQPASPAHPTPLHRPPATARHARRGGRMGAEAPVSSRETAEIYDAVIIGAGVAGLSALAAFIQAGWHNVLVLEARGRTGGRIKTVRLTGGKGGACNVGANYVHGCDPAGENVMYNLFREAKLPGLTQPGTGVERWLDHRGQEINPARVEELKDLYQKVDEMALEHARSAKKAGSAEEPLGETFELMLRALEQKRTRRAPVKLESEQDREVFAFIQKNQHAYCEEAAKLSTFDLVDTFDTGTLNGGDMMTLDGYDHVIKHLESKAKAGQILLNKEVSQVQWGTSGCTVTTKGELEHYHARAVICTLPLGVLKHNCVAFDPPLPQRKMEAIQRLGTGLENRILLRFSKPFWPEHIHFFRGLAAPHLKIMNLHSYGGHDNALLIFVTPPFSREMELIPGDEKLLKEYILPKLRQIFKVKKLPRLCESHISRWGIDPHARMSYSCIPVGASVADVRALASPEEGLYFAGEACSVTDMQMTHGAMKTGQDAAGRLMARLAESRRHDDGALSWGAARIVLDWFSARYGRPRVSRSDQRALAVRCNATPGAVGRWLDHLRAQTIEIGEGSGPAVMSTPVNEVGVRIEGAGTRCCSCDVGTPSGATGLTSVQHHTEWYRPRALMCGAVLESGDTGYWCRECLQRWKRNRARCKGCDYVPRTSEMQERKPCPRCFELLPANKGDGASLK